MEWAEGSALVPFGSDAELEAWVQRFGSPLSCGGTSGGGVIFEPRWRRVRGASAEPDVDAGGEIAWTDGALIVLRGQRLISLPRDPHALIASAVTLPAGSHSKLFALQDAVLVVTEGREEARVTRYAVDRDARLREQRHVLLPPSGIAGCVARPQDGTWVTGGRFVLYTGRALDPARAPLPSALAIDRGASLHRPVVLRVARPTLHAAITCDLALAACETIGVVADAATATHVSPGALYVWTEAPIVYRLPSGGGAVAATHVPLAPPGGSIDFDETEHGLRIALVADASTDGALPRAALVPSTMGAEPIAAPIPVVMEAPAVSLFDDAGWLGARGARLTFAALDGRSRPTSVDLSHEVDALVRPVARSGPIDSRVVALRTRGPLALTLVSRGAQAPTPARWAASDGARALGAAYVEERDTLRVGVPARFALPLAHPQEVAGAIFLELRDDELVPIGHLVAWNRVVDERCPIECHERGLRSHAFLVGDRAFSIVGLHLAEARILDGALADVRRIELDARTP